MESDQVPLAPENTQEQHSPLDIGYQQPKSLSGKIFDYSSWVILFFFAPFTVAVFLSQNSIPGDLFYPVKRGLENIVLAGASLHPSTRAMFHTNISGRRFAEAETLLLTRSDATGLQTFITQVETAQIAVNNISDPKEKQRLSQELVVKINEYQTKLVVVSAKTHEQNQITEVVPTPTLSIPTSSPTLTPVPIVPLEKTPAIPTVQSTATTVPTQIPTTIPTQPQNTPSLQQQPPSEKKQEIEKAISDTQKDLDRIKKELEEREKRRAEEKAEELRQRLQKEEERQRKKEEEKQQKRSEESSPKDKSQNKEKERKEQAEP